MNLDYFFLETDHVGVGALRSPDVQQPSITTFCVTKHRKPPKQQNEFPSVETRARAPLPGPVSVLERGHRSR
jgi:hypothetical protein